MAPVKVYTKSYCPYCVKAKNLLKNKNVPFEEIDVEHDEALFNSLKTKTGMRTVPMIFVGEKLVGGYSDLQALEDEGKLDSLLEAK